VGAEDEGEGGEGGGIEEEGGGNGDGTIYLFRVTEERKIK
jgi:hypothetical protein